MVQLFTQGDLGEVLTKRKQHVEAQVLRCTLQQLEGNLEGVINALVKESTPHLPTLQVDNITRKHANYGDGTIIIAVPFDGDTNFFHFRPNRYDQGVHVDSIGPAELRIKIDNSASAQSIKQTVDGKIAHINQYLEWQREQCEPWIAQLTEFVRQCVTQRLEGIKRFEQKMSDLGWPEK